MNSMLSTRLAFPSLMIFVLVLAAVPSSAVEFHDGDRVVLLGDALIEQEQYSAWIETMLTASQPNLSLSFRNLGWNADTPAGDSRFGLSLLQAGREPADEGWKQLCAQLEQTQPDVLILGYGMASGLEGGMDGLENFQRDYQRLVDKARQLSPQVRFLMLSPIRPLETDEQLAKTLETYRLAIKRLAEQNQSEFVDLWKTADLAEHRKDPIHVNENGYREIAKSLAEELGLDATQWLEHPNLDALRKVILRKNEWWFHRSRPANMAYVFGFRKHEQGQNAAEIPQFDTLIVEEEQRIAKLRQRTAVQIIEAPLRLDSEYAEFEPQPLPEFTVGDDLEITLWAQNPDLNKPIHMNFDPQGRLWVASSQAYPMIEVGQSAPDKVIVLEDSDQDGKADKSTVFADGLLIPTGILPGNGGVYVAQSTDLLFLRDSDGDGKADEKQRVLSGFGTEDTHHNLHTLLWGPDGRLYMNQSVYTRTDTETPHGVVRLKAGGGFRYNTQNMRMEIFFRGLWNSWGHQFDSYGQSFMTDGAGFAGVAYGFPGATFNPTPKARRQLDLISPGNWPKFASLEIISGNTFPADWQGSLITCDFRANRVTRFSLREQDAGFVTSQEADLVRTSAATFRPIDVKQGPDGALYIADWSNPIINHGEVDFRDPRRDRWHGRIWRVSWKGASGKPKRNLAALETTALLSLLNSDDRYDRDQSRRVLVERGAEAESAVRAWTVAQIHDEGRLQALWLCQAMELPTPGLLGKLLLSKDHRVRAAAVRVLGCWLDPAKQPRPYLDYAEETTRQQLSKLIKDPHPRVRLETVRALAKLGSVEAGLLALTIADQPMDRFLEHALFLTVNEMAADLMAALENDQFTGTDRQLEFLLTAVEPRLATDFLSQRVKEGSLASDGSGPWIELIGKAGGPRELWRLLKQAQDGGFDPEATARAIDAVWSAQRLRKISPNPRVSLGNLFGAADDQVKLAAIRLAEVWKDERSVNDLISFATRDLDLPIRLAAIRALESIGGNKAVGALTGLAKHAVTDEISQASTFALAKLDPATAIEPLFELLAKSDSEAEALELWRSALAIQGVGNKLAGEIAEHTLSESVLSAGLRATRDGGREEPQLASKLQEMLGDAASQEITAEQMEQLVAGLSQGNPNRGEMVYRRQQLACVTCHAIGGVGGKVGPDMTSLGASAPADYIVESLFDPNAKIKEGFHSTLVATEDNQIFNGIEVANSENELILRDAENQLVRIPKIDIVGRKQGPSLMPTGVIDRLSRQEQLDLISFLTRLGKPGKFDASQGGVARAYGVFAGTHRREQQGTDNIITGQVTGWKPAHAFVNGDLPGAELLELTRQPINIALVHVYLKTKIEVANGGAVRFTTSEPAALWVDGKQISGERRFTTSLNAGQHTLVIRLDARALPEHFRLESDDVAFLGEPL